MWNSLFNRSHDDDRSRAGIDASALPLQRPFAERMLSEFGKLRWEARKHGGQLPVGALPQLGRIEDVMVPLLEHLVTSPPSVDEEIAIQGMVSDYLPTTLRAYVGLGRQVALAARPDGRTPGDDLLEQLVMLEVAAEDLSRAVYAHDAQVLETQGRFLSTKFNRSDLDL